MKRCVVIGNWILIQRGSMNGTVSFDQDWAAYGNEFGSHDGDDNFWMGFKKISYFCQNMGCKLKVEVDKTF